MSLESAQKIFQEAEIFGVQVEWRRTSFECGIIYSLFCFADLEQDCPQHSLSLRQLGLTWLRSSLEHPLIIRVTISGRSADLLDRCLARMHGAWLFRGTRFWCPPQSRLLHGGACDPEGML